MIAAASPCCEPIRTSRSRRRRSTRGPARARAQRPSSCVQHAAASRTSPTRCSSVSTSLERAGGDHPPRAQQQGVGEARRDLLDVVGDQHRRGRRPRPWRAPTACETRSSRPPRSRPAAGSSSSSSSGSVISARAICTRLRSPSLERAEGAVGEVRRRRPRRAARRPGRGRGRRTSSRQRPTTAYDAETTTSRTRSSRGIRSARAALVSPIRGRSSKTSTVPSTSPRMPATPGGRVDLRGRDLQQRGLAGAVGAEDHPALVLLDRPVDAVEQGGLAPPDGDVGELEHGVHADWDLRGGVVGFGWGRTPTYTAGLAASAPAPRLRRLAAVSPSAARSPRVLARGSTAWSPGAASLDDARDADRRATTPPTTWSACPARRRPSPLILALGLLRGARRDRCRARAAGAGRPAGPGRPGCLQRRGVGGRRGGRRWTAPPRAGPAPDRRAAWCGRCHRAVPAARCPTRRRPTGPAQALLEATRRAGRPRRGPLAARGRRRADGPAPPAADSACPAAMARRAVRLARWRPRAARSSTWPWRTTAAASPRAEADQRRAALGAARPRRAPGRGRAPARALAWRARLASCPCWTTPIASSRAPC